MTGGDNSQGASPQKKTPGFFAGMYDSGGYIPRGCSPHHSGDYGRQRGRSPAAGHIGRTVNQLRAILAPASSHESAGSFIPSCN
jgi:hypothetical protein